MRKFLATFGLLALAGIAVSFLFAEPPKKIRQCTGTTKKGKRCSREATRGGRYCPQHEKLPHRRERGEEVAHDS
jgi:hypothetical protein